jgi:hypothetical protein
VAAHRVEQLPVDLHRVEQHPAVKLLAVL